jgi:hypothetical protein
MGLACLYDNCYTGTCQTPVAAPTLACVPNGEACGGPECCGGECRSGICAPWTPCGEVSAICLSDLDCCANFACQSGICQPTCNQLYHSCQSNADCCIEEGLECTIIPDQGGVTSPICYPGNPIQPLDSQGNAILCGAPCSGWECQVGAACAVSGGVDPCVAAGLVCDTSFHVCRFPETGSPLTGVIDLCQPFGSPCQPIAGSSAEPVCVPGLTIGGVAGDYCVQACATSSDCVDPVDDCLADPAGGGSFCAQWDACQANQFFGPCNAAGTNDGLCYPLDFGSGALGFCIQTTPDGGAAGDRCLYNLEGSRQEGGLCDGKDICSLLGLCEPICNAGTSGTPGCPAGQHCFPFLNGLDDQPVEMGFCSPTCDFTVSDGGGCPLDSSGIQEKCLPEIFDQLPDSATGLCGAGVAAPVPVGQVCNYTVDGEIRAADDNCVPGAACYSTSVFTPANTCFQLCDKVGQSGGGCSGSQVCQPLIVAGLTSNPTHTGYCQ